MVRWVNEQMPVSLEAHSAAYAMPCAAPERGSCTSGFLCLECTSLKLEPPFHIPFSPWLPYL